MGNAAFKWWLNCPAEDWQKAVKRDIVAYTGLAYDLVTSVQSQRPRYSEIFLETPLGSGVARLHVDRWTYWMNTSSGDDYHKFNQVLEKLGSVEATLDFLAAQGQQG
jgi:conjugal transfer ATP-binding protein TraC